MVAVFRSSGRGALEGPPRHVETLTFQGASASSSGQPHLSYTGPGRGGGCERAAVCGPRGLVRAQVTRPAPPWARRARAACSPGSTPPELMQWIVDLVFSFDVRGTKAAWQNTHELGERYNYHSRLNSHKRILSMCRLTGSHLLPTVSAHYRMKYSAQHHKLLYGSIRIHMVSKCPITSVILWKLH